MRGSLLYLVVSLTVPVALGRGGETALRCGALIDVQKGVLVRNAVILIEGGRITAVGESLTIPEGAAVIDLSAMTVLPGMIDMHCHFLDSPEERTRGSAADLALTGVRNARTILLSGFTTIRDPGGGSPNYANVSVRDALARGWFEGPRVFAAGRFLSATGGHGDYNGLPPEREMSPEGIVDGVEEMRKAVRRDTKYGAEWIKLYVTGGFLSAGDDPGQQHFSDEEIRVAVEEAERVGKFVSAHAHGAQGIKAAVKAGVRTIEHGTFIDDEGIELMRSRGTYLVPTMRTIEILAEDPGQNASAGRKKAYELSKKYFLQMLQNVGRAAKQGVKVCVGSDLVTVPHGRAAQELALHVRAGRSPIDAIRSATIVSAEALNQRSDIGSIEPGKRADIVGVYGEPLNDIRALERVSFVMKEGVVYKHEERK